MSDRYFVETPITGGRARLAGSEAHHLSRVMRAGPGEQVVLFDGSGAEFTAQVERITGSGVELAVLARHKVDRELPLELTLAVSLPKRGRQRWLVEKSVELGVARLVPVLSKRSVARVGPRGLARLRRTVIEASKQCGRNRLMAMAEPQAWPDFVAATQGAKCRLLAHPAGWGAETRRSGDPASPKQVRVSGAATLAIGPEGGFTPDEVTLGTSAGWELVDLGPRILRVETAAVLLVALALRSVQQP